VNSDHDMILVVSQKREQAKSGFILTLFSLALTIYLVVKCHCVVCAVSAV
jgi:hypothetical protein